MRILASDSSFNQHSEISLAEDIGLSAWSPLTRSMTSDKYLDGARPTGAHLSMYSVSQDVKAVNNSGNFSGSFSMLSITL